MDQNKTSTLAGAFLLLAVLAGVFTLAWHGSITGGAALGVVGTIIGIAGGAFAVHSGVKAGSVASAIGGSNPPDIKLQMDGRTVGEVVSKHIDDRGNRS